MSNTYENLSGEELKNVFIQLKTKYQTEANTDYHKKYHKLNYEKTKEHQQITARHKYYKNKFGLSAEQTEGLTNEEIIIVGNAKLYLERLLENEKTKPFFKNLILPLIF